MKVLFVSHNANRAGAPLALLQELQVIKSKRPKLEAEVLFLKDGDLKEDFKELFPVLICRNSNNSLLNRILRRLKIKRYPNDYLSLCKKGHYNLIYANTVASFDAAIKIKNKLQIPLIGHVHEAESLVKEHNMTKEHFEEFDKIITVSELALNNLIANYEVPKQKITIQRPISKWVEKLINGNIIVPPKNKENYDYEIAVFSNPGWQKGLDILPYVIDAFSKNHPDVKCMFYIVGNIGPKHRYHIQYDLKRMSLSDRVKWLGLVNCPLNILSQVDTLLILSREESFSLVAEEAAAVGTPIVCFEGATGAGEWIRKGAGILVPYMDFDYLAKTLYNLYSNSLLRTAIGKRGKEIVTDILKEDCQMNTIVEVIDEFS